MTDRPADPAQSAPSAEPRKVTGGLGGKFYLSPDGNFLIWDNKPPDHADDAHRGLWYELMKAMLPWKLLPSHQEGWAGMPTLEQQNEAYQWRARYCRHWFEKDSILANTVTIAMAAYGESVRAATIERCAQIADAAAENEHTMMLGLRKSGLGEATVGSEKLVKLGKHVAAAIRSMGDEK